MSVLPDRPGTLIRQLWIPSNRGPSSARTTCAPLEQLSRGSARCRVQPVSKSHSGVESAWACCGHFLERMFLTKLTARTIDGVSGMLISTCTPPQLVFFFLCECLGSGCTWAWCFKLEDFLAPFSTYSSCYPLLRTERSGLSQ